MCEWSKSFASNLACDALFINMLSPSSGWVNRLVVDFGGEPIHFLLKPEYFRTILVSAEIWKELGWGTIIYQARLRPWTRPFMNGHDRWGQPAFFGFAGRQRFGYRLRTNRSNVE